MLLNSIRHLTATALLLTAPVALANDVQHTYDVTAGGTLDISTDVGKLNIETHQQASVVIAVEVDGSRADEFEVSHKVEGGDVFIKGTLEDKRYWGRDIKVRYNITVPENYHLALQTSGGSVDIEDLVGNVNVNTSGGKIHIGDIDGNVDLHTSGGSITTGSVKGQLDAHTSGGSINATFAQQLQESATLNTSGGSINVKLIDDIKIDVNATTSGGRVRSDFAVDGRITKKSMRGEINGGGPRLKLHTSGGSISIEAI